MCYNILAIWEVQEQLVNGSLHKTLKVTNENKIHNFDLAYFTYKEDRATALFDAINLVHAEGWGIEIVEGIFQYIDSEGKLKQTTSMQEFDKATSPMKKAKWRWVGVPMGIPTTLNLTNLSLVTLVWGPHSILMRVQNDELCLRYQGAIRLVKDKTQYMQSWCADYYLDQKPIEPVVGKLFNANGDCILENIQMHFHALAVLKQ